jgi:hypothetical protein
LDNRRRKMADFVENKTETPQEEEKVNEQATAAGEDAGEEEGGNANPEVLRNFEFF